MKFNVAVDAVQWMKPGDHPDVVAAGPKMARKGEVGYVTGVTPRPTCWVEIEPLLVRPDDCDGGLFSPFIVELTHPKTGEKYWRRCYPFACWKFSGTTTEAPIASDELFYQDCHLIESRGDVNFPDWQVNGWLKPPAKDGRIAVFPGNWIVTSSSGLRAIMDDDEFRRMYPQMTGG